MGREGKESTNLGCSPGRAISPTCELWGMSPPLQTSVVLSVKSYLNGKTLKVPLT